MSARRIGGGITERLSKMFLRAARLSSIWARRKFGRGFMWTLMS